MRSAEFAPGMTVYLDIEQDCLLNYISRQGPIKFADLNERQQDIVHALKIKNLVREAKSKKNNEVYVLSNVNPKSETPKPNKNNA